jgi:hypothetical protein
MIRMSLRASLVCLLGAHMAACSAAGDAPSLGNGTAAEKPGIELDVGTDTDAETEGAGSWGMDSGSPNGDDADDAADPGSREPADDERDGCGCACKGGVLPGISIGKDGTISIELPHIGVVVVQTNGATCQMAAGGLNVTGDVTLDLGSGTDIPLLDADLDITPGAGGGLPNISGTASIGGASLGPIAGSLLDATIPVTLELDTDTEVPGSVTGVSLDLALELPNISLPTGGLPALADALALLDADVVMATDGCNRLIKVWGTVEADASLVLAAMPIAAGADLEAAVTIANDSLVSVMLEGDMTLLGEQLWCGNSPLVAVTVPEAKLMIDERGAMLIGEAHAAIHPSISVSANALVNAKLSEDEWSIKVCADAALDLHLLGAEASACVNLTTNGVVSCACDCVDDDDSIPDREH